MLLLTHKPDTDYGRHRSFENPARLARFFEAWCGETPWSKQLRRLGELGGLVKHYCGVPRSASAIPLCFSILLPDGHEFPCDSRLKDLRAAVKYLENYRKYYEGPYRRGSYERFLKAQDEYYKEKEIR